MLRYSGIAVINPVLMDALLNLLKKGEKIEMASKAEQVELDDAVKAAREKLKARFGDKVRIGGKGKKHLWFV